MNTERLTLIETRLKQAFSPEFLEVNDDSDQHVGHAGHQGGGRHFSVTIKAACFNALSLVAAHREIYALFTDMMPDKIHALKIKIIK